MLVRMSRGVLLGLSCGLFRQANHCMARDCIAFGRSLGRRRVGVLCRIGVGLCRKTKWKWPKNQPKNQEPPYEFLRTKHTTVCPAFSTKTSTWSCLRSPDIQLGGAEGKSFRPEHPVLCDCCLSCCTCSSIQCFCWMYLHKPSEAHLWCNRCISSRG